MTRPRRPLRFGLPVQLLDAVNDPDSSSSEHGANAMPLEAPSARFKVANILIVEDEGIVALDIRMRLKRMGHNVIGTVDTGQDAIVMATTRFPDIILMDIRLKSDMDGIEAAEAINNSCAIPVIYLTGQLDSVTVDRAQKTNPAGYLAKPFTVSDLELLIQTILSEV